MLEVISAYYFADDTDVQYLVKDLTDLIDFGVVEIGTERFLYEKPRYLFDPDPPPTREWVDTDMWTLTVKALPDTAQAVRDLMVKYGLTPL